MCRQTRRKPSTWFVHGELESCEERCGENRVQQGSKLHPIPRHREAACAPNPRRRPPTYSLRQEPLRPPANYTLLTGARATPEDVVHQGRDDGLSRHPPSTDTQPRSAGRVVAPHHRSAAKESRRHSSFLGSRPSPDPDIPLLESSSIPTDMGLHTGKGDCAASGQSARCGANKKGMSADFRFR